MTLSEQTGLVHRAMYDQAIAERDEARAILGVLRGAKWAADIEGPECHLELWWPSDDAGRAAIKAVLAVLRSA